MNYSTEQAARIVQVLGFLLALFHKNLGIDNDTLTVTLGAIIFAVSTVYGWVRRWQRGDLKLLGARIK